MNSRFRNTLVLLLKHVLKDKGLPVLVNVVWPTLLRVGAFLYATENPGLILSGEAEEEAGADGGPAGTHEEAVGKALDVKRSQHRSASAFLQWAANEGILALHEDAHGALSITSVNRTHTIFRAVRLANPDALKASLEAGLPAVESGGPNSKLEIIVAEKYKLPKNLREVMRAVAASSKSSLEEYITPAQLKDVLTAHFKEHKLDSTTDRASIDVPFDDPLWALAAAASKSQSTSAAPMPAQNAPTAAAAPPPQAIASEYGGDGPPCGNDGYEDDQLWLDAQQRADAEAAAGGRVIAGVWVPTKAPAALSMGGGGPGGGASSAWHSGQGSLTAASTWKAGGAKVVSLSARAAPPSPAAPPAAPSFAETAALSSARKEKKKAAAVAAGAELTGAVSVRKDVLMKFVASKLTKCHSIQHYPGAVPIYATGVPPCVEIVVELVRARKHMTHVRGLEAFGVDLGVLARGLQKKLAAAASVGPCGDNPQMQEVFIQGNMAHQVEDFLSSDCGFKKSMLTVSLKKGVKGK